MIRKLLALTLFLVPVLSHAQVQGLDEKSTEALTKMVKLQTFFLDGRGNDLWPQPYVKEIGRKPGDDGKTLIGYQFFAPALPKDKKYTLMVWNIVGDPYPAWKDLTLAADGKALCTASPPDPLDLWLPAGDGEPKRFILTSDDEKSKAFMTVTPFPIEGKDKDCNIQAQILLPDAVAVLISGQGFPPNSKAHLSGNSEGEMQSHDVTADDGGRFHVTLLPYKAGTTKGHMSVDFKSPVCDPKLKFEWGKGTFHEK